MERDHHRLTRQQRWHVELQHLLTSLKDRLDAAQVALARGTARQRLDLGADLVVNQSRTTAKLQGQGVSVDRDQIHQPAINNVKNATFGAGLLSIGELFERGTVFARTSTALDHAVHLVE